MELFRKYRNPSNSSPGAQAFPGVDPFRRYGKPGSSSPRPGLAGRKKGFRGAAIQAVVYLLDGAHVTLLVSELP